MDDLQAIDAFAQSYAAAGRSRRSQRLRRDCLRRAHAGLAAQGTTLLAASRTDIEAYYVSRKWSLATLASESGALRVFYAWARKTGLRADDPTEDIPRPKVRKGIPRPVPLTRYRAARAKAQAKGPRSVLMLDLPARMGLRCHEAAKAHTDDFDEGRMRIRGKGDVERVVPVPKDLQAIIDGLPVGWLFPSRRGGGAQHITPGRLAAVVSEMLGTGSGWTTHTLRHRFATNILAATDNLLITQELLGHSSPATTQIYTALMDGKKRSAVEAAEKLLNQADQDPTTGAGSY